MNSGSRESNLVPAKTENAYTVNAFSLELVIVYAEQSQYTFKMKFSVVANLTKVNSWSVLLL